ncbi:MAG: lytic transglycosylase domain-containing protein [Proteobacteria bacterium]|nr:lytic transglycosylase domain-containing protein [Pseudomonadota bacterium]
MARATLTVILALLTGCLGSAAAYADIYRYQTPDGEIVLTTSPRKDLKLIGVIRNDARPAAKAPSSPSSPQTKVNAAMREQAYDAYIEEAANLYGIPKAFIKAVIKIESNFNPRAVSSAGAMGLMQLMPGTAKHMGVEDPFDPRQNIMGGVKYLRRLSDRFDGDINLVLSGYHAGPGNVAKVGGIPFADTQRYIRNVYAWYLRYQAED